MYSIPRDLSLSLSSLSPPLSLFHEPTTEAARVSRNKDIVHTVGQGPINPEEGINQPMHRRRTRGKNLGVVGMASA